MASYDKPSQANSVPKLLEDWGMTRFVQPVDDDRFDLLTDFAEYSEKASLGQTDLGQRMCFQDLAGRARSSQQAGWRLSLRLPSGMDPAYCRHCIGQRLFLWPRTLQKASWRALVSSRLPRTLDERPAWFRTLRAAVATVAEDEVLAIVPRTAAQPFVRRAGELLGKRLVHIDCDATRGAWQDWLLNRIYSTQRLANPSFPRVFVSPPIAAPTGDAAIDTELFDVPERDRLLVGCCGSICALQVRRGGHIHRLLRSRLAGRIQGDSNVRIALGNQLIDDDVRDELLAAGAIGWAVLDKIASSRFKVRTGDRQQEEVLFPSMLPAGHYLTHCTRRRTGPWPDQTDREFQDDLILLRSDADHSPMAALKRIVQTQRLVATGEGIRRSRPHREVRVVSFTSVPLAELRSLRVFRPHRGRWDFEPYGLCLDIGCLQRLGVQPVTYVSDTSERGPETAAWLQKAISGNKRGGQIDWTVEQEWRHVGDLDLSKLPSSAIHVFVPTQEEARQLAEMSPWPVIVTPT